FPTVAFLSSFSPPPRPALFPYTTLFRSRIDARLLGGQVLALGCKRRRLTVGRRTNLVEARINRLQPWPERRSACQQLAVHFLELDRKSTRLNSSHVKISYAVFCLKKQKN